jgi:hypothetical protein
MPRNKKGSHIIKIKNKHTHLHTDGNHEYKEKPESIRKGLIAQSERYHDQNITNLRASMVYRLQTKQSIQSTIREHNVLVSYSLPILPPPPPGKKNNFLILGSFNGYSTSLMRIQKLLPYL